MVRGMFRRGFRCEGVREIPGWQGRRETPQYVNCTPVVKRRSVVRKPGSGRLS